MQQKLSTESKKFNQTELGFFPTDWEKTKIINYCEIATGGTPKTEVKIYWDPPEIPWMKSGEIQGNRIRSVNTFISRKGLDNSNAKWLPKNSVVIALAGRGKTRGTTAILETECTCNQSVVCLIPKKGLFYEFLHYYLSNLYSYIRNLTGDKDRSGLNKEIIGNIPLFLPPTSEQYKIAYVLSTIQFTKEKTEHIINALHKLKKAMMKHLFTYGPVSLGTAGKIKTKNTEIGKIKDDYKIVKLKDISLSYKNGIYKKNEFYGNGYPSIRMYNIVDGRVNVLNSPLLNVTKKELDVFGIKQGDLLINRVNSNDLVGKAGVLLTDIGPATFESKNIRVRLNEKMVLPEYISYYIQTPFYLKQIRLMTRAAVSQVTINQDDLDRISIILPIISDQEKIVSILTNIDKKISAEVIKKNSLDELFKSMLHNLMTAKIRVNDLVIPNEKN